MARVKQTVVAVVHGSDEGAGVDVEVYPYDPAIANGYKAQELLRSWRPQPGELDDRESVNRRVRALQRTPGHSLVPQDRGARGFLTRAREGELTWGRTVSGNSASPIHDASYEYELGEVLLFDAEIDTDTLHIDWNTAVPHPSTDPQTIPHTGLLHRFDGVMLDPEACRQRIHLTKVTPDGTMHPFNEAGQLVTSLTSQEQVDYINADRTQLPHRGPLLITVDFGNGDPNAARLRAQPADVAMRAGTIEPIAPHQGVAFRPADLELLRRAAGDQHARITDANGSTVGAVYLVEADYGMPGLPGSVVFDALGASDATHSDPSIGSLSVTQVGGQLQVRTSGTRFATANPERSPVASSAFLGGTAPTRGQRWPADSAGYSHGPGAGGDRRSTAQTSAGESAQAERKALAAIHSRTAALVREHGPTVVNATKKKLKDPAVQAMLKKSMLTAVEVGLAGKGGSSLKFAKAASTAIRVSDIVATAQSQQLRTDGKSPGPSL